MRRKEKEIQNKDEIIEVLEKGEICRLGLCDNNIPYIVPMNYGYSNNHLFFHSAKTGKKIEIIKNNNMACFEIEVDTEISKKKLACNWGMKYKTVIGFGKLCEVTDPSEKKKGLSVIMKQYSGSDEWSFPDSNIDKVLVYKMHIDHITGKISLLDS
jgi:nitroimidazol reductase NimA-like FMN-containing flavoprotein (pyridoxamine 5'-phosphate oxidase superfamily)